MATFLDSLGLGESKIDVYVTVSFANGMEMATLDSRGNISTYAQLPIDYNDTKREILSYDKFKQNLEELFNNSNINEKKANIHLSLPSVWFGLKEGIPLMFDDEAIENIIIGELDQTYIFKRSDPEIAWFEAYSSSGAELRSVFYTAIQKEVILKINDIVEELGAKLVSIGNELIADVRGLLATGIASQQMNDPDCSWSLMVINNSGYQLINFQGKKMMEYFEEPLPIKSYEGEEIYNAIANSVQIGLMNSPSSSLIILSQTDLVSAEILTKGIQFSGPISFAEDNKYKKDPFVELSLDILQEDQLKVSLHLIGSVVPASVLPYNVNFLSEQEGIQAEVSIDIPIGNGQIIKLTPKLALIISAIIGVILCSLTGLGFVAIHASDSKLQTQVTELETQIKDLDEELAKYEKGSTSSAFDSVAQIEKVLKYNRAKIMAYASLGESVPKNLYLTYFMTGDDGLINIKGYANSVEDVYVFFKNLKDSLIESNLRLSKLNLKSGSLDNVLNSSESSIDNAPYLFEITNMNDNQMSSFAGALADKAKDASANNAAAGAANQPAANQPAAAPAAAPAKPAPSSEPSAQEEDY